MEDGGWPPQPLLDQAADGRGGVLFLVGETGLGETTMLEAAIEKGRGRFRVGVGQADVAEASLPFGILAQALSPLLDDDLACQLFGATDEDGADTPAPGRFFALLRSIRAAAMQPLLLACDDLHWADADSLAFRHFLCRRIGSLPLALIATMRPWPDVALGSATNLPAQRLAEIQQLERLSETAAEAVVHVHADGGLCRTGVASTTTSLRRTSTRTATGSGCHPSSSAPHARRGFIDHQTLSFDAILKFIEADFLSGRRLDRTPTDDRPLPTSARSHRNSATSPTSTATKPLRPLILPLHPPPGPASRPGG